MDFDEIISIAGYAIEAIGVLIIVLISTVSSFRFLTHIKKESEGVVYRTW